MRILGQPFFQNFDLIPQNGVLGFQYGEVGRQLGQTLGELVEHPRRPLGVIMADR